MTVIGALSDGQGGYYIGSDTLSTVGGHRCSTKERKIITRPDGWAIGSAGASRTRDLLSEYWPDLDTSTPFALSKALREMFVTDQWDPISGDGEASKFRVDLVVCGPGVLWQVFADLQVAPYDPSFVPGVFIGSGSELALGAAIYGTKAGDPPEAVLYRALEAACKIDVGCGGEIVVHHLPKPPAEAPQDPE